MTDYPELNDKLSRLAYEIFREYLPQESSARTEQDKRIFRFALEMDRVAAWTSDKSQCSHPEYLVLDGEERCVECGADTSHIDWMGR